MDIREALEAKYDEIEAEPKAEETSPAEAAAPAEAPPEVEAAPAEETTEQKAERARDESGKFTKAPKAAKTAPEAPKATAAPAPTPAEPVAPPVVTPSLKAPQSWKPALREQFGKLPPDVQSEVLRRERETAIALQKAAEAEKSDKPIRDLLGPYESAIRAQNIDPKQYLSNVLQQAHVIFNGPPQNRASALADIIMQAGVPPELLDRALVAKMNGQAPQMAPQQAPQQFHDPRVDQLLQQAEQRQAAEASERAAAFMDDAKHPFAQDVREQMADILEVWGRQGKKSISADDMERAYSIACQMNPDVAPLIEQRKAAEAAKRAAAATAQARKAASSPRSSPTSTPSAAPKGIRAALEAKADELGLE